MSEETLSIDRHAVEPFLKNGYILTCARTGRAICIDPGDEAPELIRTLEEKQPQVVAIVLTHAHMDHISGVGRVKERWDVPIYLHPEDDGLYRSLPQQASFFGFDYGPAPAWDRELKEGEPFRLGELVIQIHHTPGHSPGSVCLEVEEHVFCGDAVFAGSIGRTDLPGGSHEVLMASIREKILPLGDDKILHPGHGPETTIGHERRTNPFIAGSPLPG